MGLFFYNIFLVLFKVGVRAGALFNNKAAKWVEGRKGIWTRLQSEIKTAYPGNQQKEPVRKSNIIWMHCASLGEFEQGRPLLEKLRVQYPHFKFLLTFFSPSGYEIRKDYKGADWVSYLPMDGATNAKQFLQIVNPALVIFVKYEFWYYYLKAVKQNNTPLLLVSALFRENSVFFKWHGTLQRKMLTFFDHLFVQNERSRSLLASIGIHHTSVSGDTRFDRVIEIAQQSRPIDIVEKFIGNDPVLVAGSTWPRDEEILQKALLQSKLKLVLAPHEISDEHLVKLGTLFPGAVFYSQLANGSAHSKNADILIIDNIGMLSSLYRYAFITYIGGGFGKGIHNTLEAAVYGKPVLFGPVYQKFQEAIDLIHCGGAFTINNAEECSHIIQKFNGDENAYKTSCESAGAYVLAKKGATQVILDHIQENRLLTR